MAERRKDVVPVAGRCRAGVSILLMNGPRETALADFRLPKLLACRLVERNHRLNLSLLISGLQKELIADDDRRRMSASGNRHFPKYVCLVAPLRQRLLTDLGDAIPAWASPLSPAAETTNAKPQTYAKNRSREFMVFLIGQNSGGESPRGRSIDSSLRPQFSVPLSPNRAIGLGLLPS